MILSLNDHFERLSKQNIYKTFHEFLVKELENALPGIVEEGVQIYRKYYTEEMENNIGVCAITLERVM